LIESCTASSRLCGARASAPDKTMENAWSKKHHCFVNLSPVGGMFSLAGACLTSKFTQTALPLVGCVQSVIGINLIHD